MTDPGAPRFDRAEIDEMVRVWIDANLECERNGDWRPLAEFYADDATYGWNYGPKEDFMAVGIDEIRDLALGQEMQGLEGWIYPYVHTMIDDRSGDVLCLWRQIAEDTEDPRTGSPFEVYGMGGSWFRYAGDQKWAWQRDFFDFGNVVDLFMKMIEADALRDGMKKRMEGAGGRKPGWYKIHTAPAPIWPVPTEPAEG